MHGILLAAGYGKRLRPLTLVRPKPLVPLHGIPLLNFGLRQLREAGCREIVLNAHHLASQIESWAADRAREFPELSIRVIREETLLGVAGGLRNLLQHLPSGPVLVQNGDVLHDFNLKELCDAHLESGAEASLVLAGEPAVVHLEQGRILGFGQRPGANRGFTGIHLLSEGMRARITAWPGKDIIPCYEDAIARGCLLRGADVKAGLWVDIGQVAEYIDWHERLWKLPAYRNLLARLGLVASFDEARCLSLAPGSCLQGEGQRAVVWSAASWKGALEDSCVLDGVRGQGFAKGEIIL